MDLLCVGHARRVVAQGLVVIFGEQFCGAGLNSTVEATVPNVVGFASILERVLRELLSALPMCFHGLVVEQLWFCELNGNIAVWRRGEGLLAMVGAGGPAPAPRWSPPGTEWSRCRRRAP